MRGKSINTLVVSTQKLFVDFHTVDALLGEFKCSKENGVDYAGARHGDSQSCKVLAQGETTKFGWDTPRYIRGLRN